MRTVPLHPAKVSIPTTCSSRDMNEDLVCHILYNADIATIRILLLPYVQGLEVSLSSNLGLMRMLAWLK